MKMMKIMTMMKMMEMMKTISKINILADDFLRKTLRRRSRG